MIFSYIVRSIIAQRTLSLVSVIVLATMTAIALVLLGFVQGLVSSVMGGGDPQIAVVIIEGSSETGGAIPLPTSNRIEALPEIAQEGGRSLVSREVVAVLPLTIEANRTDNVAIRGLEARGLAVHGRVRIEGRFPAQDEPGVVIGVSLVGRHEGFVPGGKIRFGSHEWPVLGTFDAGGSPFESEIWCDRTLLRNTLHRTADSSLFARLTSPGAQGSFASGVASGRSDHLRAYAEPEYFRYQLKELALYFDVVYLILAVLVISMVLSSANTIYTSFLGRTRELATLMTIGFTRRRIMLMMTIESVVLTVTGAFVGMVIALPARGRHFAIDELSFVTSIRISPQVLAAGLLIGLTTGLLSSVVANVQIARIDVLRGLRD